MAKYHINDQGEARVCRARKACPFGDLETEHYSSPDEARQAYEKIMSRDTQSLSSSSQVPISPYRLQPGNAAYIIDYDYDSYGPEHDYYWDDTKDYEDYNEYLVYEGLRIDAVSFDDVRGYAAARIGVSGNSITGWALPSELETELAAHRDEFTTPDAWEIEAVGDYYGQSVSIEAPRDLDQLIDDWYWNQEGTVDADEILPYIRDRGMDTKGMKPLKAIKEYLAYENKGMRLREVENCRNFSVHSINFKKLNIPNSKHLATVDPRPAAPGRGASTTKRFAGVVIDQGNGTYKLMDGYHRYKHLSQNTKSKAGMYIVLTPNR